MRIIGSMTTIPSRIDHIRPAIESAFAQTRPIDHLEINIPHVCVRTKETYVIPAWLEGMDRVQIHRTEDYGSITKIAPTLLRHRREPDTWIWSLDDDFSYQLDQLELLLRCPDPQEGRIVTRHGGIILAGGEISFCGGYGKVTFIEGHGTVLYPTSCIRDDFLRYVEISAGNMECRSSDDAVLSFYFNYHRVPIHLQNPISDDVPFYQTGHLAHWNDEHALHHQNDGHLERYKRVFRYLSSIPLSPAP